MFWPRNSKHDFALHFGSTAESHVSVTYDALERLSAEVSEHLFQRSHKQLIFILCRQDIGSIAAYLGTLKAGQTACLLDDQMAPEHLSKLIAAYDPEYVIRSRRSRSPSPIGLKLVGEINEADLQILSSGHRSTTAIFDETALLLPTSGTTGSPKMVRLSVANLLANARSIADYLHIDCSDRAIMSLPIHYSYGLSVLNSHLVRGASLAVPDDSLIRPGFWESFRHHGCTSFAGVPLQYQMLDRIGFERLDLPTLKTMTQAGGRLSLELVDKFALLSRDRGFNFFVMYGQTEATARMTFLPPDKLAAKRGSVGKPIPNGRLFVDVGGEIANRSTAEGEVIYEGPNVMLGYAESRTDLARGNELKGRLHTGDLGWLDEDGYLFLTGRTKRIAKVFGLRINLDEVEATLDVRVPSAVVTQGEKIVVFCENVSIDFCKELRTTLAAKLRLNHNAIDVRSLKALPQNSSGKIDYKALRVLGDAG